MNYSFKSIGADPEGFYFNGAGRLVPAFDILPNTKDHPKELGDGRFILADNAMIELCINPTSGKREFLKEISTTLRVAHRFLPPGGVLKFIESVELNNSHLDNPMAMEFGCSEDFCVYQSDTEYADLMGTATRTGGGHVHIGFDTDDAEGIKNLVKACDLTLLAPRVAAGPAKSNRHLFYGRAGMHRPKPYGLEYRSLSNFWLDNLNLTAWVYDGVVKAFKMLNDNSTYDYINNLEDTVGNLVETWDSKKAMELCDNLGIEIPKL